MTINYLYFDSGEETGPPSRIRISFSGAPRFSIDFQNFERNLNEWLTYGNGVTIREERLDDLIEALQKLKKLYVLK